MKQLGKFQVALLAEIEEHLLSISEALNGMGLLESSMNEIYVKGDRIDKMAGRLEAMPIRELIKGRGPRRQGHSCCWFRA